MHLSAGDVLAGEVGMTLSSCLRVLGIGLVALSCTGAPKRPEASSPRVRDSAPEKLASQRAAAPHSLTLEQDDERWGFEAARERRREEKARQAQRQPAAGDKALDVTTPTARGRVRPLLASARRCHEGRDTPLSGRQRTSAAAAPPTR
jgi:hypothetical protein